MPSWRKPPWATLPFLREGWRVAEAERAARLAAEAASERLALLADVTKALTSSFELDVMLNELARLITPRVADAFFIDLVEADGTVRPGARAVAPGCEGWAAGLRAIEPLAGHEDHTAARALRSGTPQVVDEHDCSGVFVPMTGRQGSLGVLSLLTQKGRGADPPTVKLAEELARRASIAVENCRLFARQRTVSETLQQSLLPERLPDIPGLMTAARYVPGGPDVDIGGDWYDLMQLPGGGIGLALGDVVGRGERAASLMGQLRNAVRAYAFEGHSPSGVVERVNGLLLEAGAEHMATMIFGILDPETGEFQFVNAGHPPPLIVDVRGGAHFISGGNGPPVGALPTARYVEACAELRPGATLLLYTDGLVEDRETPLGEGLDRLQKAAVANPDDLEAFCSNLMRRVIGTAQCDDDVALLAVQLTELADELHLCVPAQPGALAPLRATLRRWLAQAGATDAEAFELLTACGEACTNAIRHASGPMRSEFEVHAGLTDDGVEICVRDRGKWRERRSPNVGGRGLPIIEAYVDELNVRPSPAGTEVRMRRRLERVARVAG
ncbi:MAG TPA: SpoIIE family protein phosphatase [Acidimicrobiia bacterium]|nr:SpoIIE family protein phosphatase [Acidimicrobiia bacterium]